MSFQDYVIPLKPAALPKAGTGFVCSLLPKRQVTPTSPIKSDFSVGFSPPRMQKSSIKPTPGILQPSPPASCPYATRDSSCPYAKKNPVNFDFNYDFFGIN
ncbi:MAG: hypothetical protein RLZ12_872 [Bacillota bacterium]|jgi:hypothetical protein